MKHLSSTESMGILLSRRSVIGAATASLGCSIMGKAMASGQISPTMSVSPPSVVSEPPRVWGNNAPLAYTPDPDVIALDPSFNDVIFGNAPLRQIWAGPQIWLEGPAWSTEGRFLLVNDVVGSKQYRFSPEERTMAVFRPESYHGNGNTFDREGRLLTCEHGLRRVIRWEHDGRCTVIADSFENKRLNSPNDIVVDNDGGVWFTDPPYGDGLWEGHPNAPIKGRPTDRHLLWNLDEEVAQEIGGQEGQQTHVFRIDPKTGKLDAVVAGGRFAGPNGLCFSPDRKTLYIASSDDKPVSGNNYGHRNIYAFNVTPDGLSEGRVFADMVLAGQKLMPDGIRADVMGNIWVGASGPLGLCGVFVYAPSGKLIGRLRMPRSISNLTFGGPQRDRLFMCSGNAIFSLDVATQGCGLS
ncbi:SMP-30/gluconolactonase/LRE family protein [Gluconobacter kondonii]|uniref:SMP-30/gluconolactonase/LRE family protein n=1 Tax=Gluconobacter kondonii TaxID=941463 RepID=UPI0020A0206C|nr:SMP-30/gluconolactonase/LRE family protein [Gluconobacter kondonii]MCP1237782.1 SMP-30/gluconolactonase/LRE family protein [Gluconobacter kondonii]